jgi:hypothetical protein
MNIQQLREKWQQNCEGYKQREIGSGVHDFVSEMFASSDLFGLTKVASKSGKFSVFTHDTVQKEQGRPDFVLYISNDVTIPVEAKCFEKINEGITQLLRYQLDYSKQYGIITDGNEWRFYRAGNFIKYDLQYIFNNSADFLIFWNNYIQSDHYYYDLFSQGINPNPLDLNNPENRAVFFYDTTKLIDNFKIKLQTIGVLTQSDDKKSVETAYSYFIQFILYKVLVDNGFTNFVAEYKTLFERVKTSITQKIFYDVVITDIKTISQYISTNIYKPFAEEQKTLNENIEKQLKMMSLVAKHDFTIDDISVWLDIILYVDKYNFANLKNEIFGFIYENYLKELYDDENKGQYFTDPELVNLMLEEIGYTPDKLKDKNKISIIDPACGAGTFLYSAVDRIINAFDDKKNSQEIAKQLEELISKNVFGLDIEEFPLYLAEMSILIRMLPFIVNNSFVNPFDEKIKLFKTKDSIAEFVDAGISAKTEVQLLPNLFSNQYEGFTFMRDFGNLEEMVESMNNNCEQERFRFDYVVANPPYIGYNKCCKQKMPFTQIKNNKNFSMANAYGVNLNTANGNIKGYSPKPNIYAYFIALGLALLKDGGKMCYIIPQTVLTATDLDVLRYHLLNYSIIEKIITFEGNLFIDRGLKQKDTIATSSLIFVVRKDNPPNSKNHLVSEQEIEVINYTPYIAEHGKSFKDYLSGSFRQKSKKIILNNYDNWNFIKWNDDEDNKIKKYIDNTMSIKEYRNKIGYNVVQFDKGLVYDKKEKNQGNKDWNLIRNNKKINLKISTDFIDTNNLRFPKGSQGIEIFKNQYKIIWRYMNLDKFYYSNKKIMVDFNWVIISSNDENEIMFLLSILNSPVTDYVFSKYLQNTNEQALLIGVNAIKNYIRIPKDTEENKTLKSQVISKTKAMLELEEKTLADFVDFNGLIVQSFDKVEVKDNNLFLIFNNQECKLNIKVKSELVAKIVSDIKTSISLSDLQNTEAIDFEEQAKLKEEVNKLVEEMYFLNKKASK